MSRNVCILILLALYILTSCTPNTTERCSRSVSKRVSFRSFTIKESQQRGNGDCVDWHFSHCADYRSVYRTVYSKVYSTRYRRTYERHYFVCPECSEWAFAEDFCQACGDCQPCRCNKVNSKSCNKRDGNCRCNEGWHGEQCDIKCEPGTYGENCMHECQCNMNNTVSCDHVDGTCRCKKGWIGTTCSHTCERWHFGSNCSKLCLCDIDNTWSCSHDDGICHCKPGWKGMACNETCPLGMYGDKCQEKCMCIEDKTTHCDQFNGTCYCREGWEGKSCEIAINTGDASQSRGASSNISAIVGITIVVILIIAVAIVIAVFFMLRRKTEKGKREITGLFIYRHTTAAAESAEDDDTITYANVANSVNQRQHSDQGDRTQNVYTEVYKGRPGEKTGNNKLDHINYGHGYTEYAVNDRPSQEGAVDGTHEAYRPKLTNEGAEYDKLAIDDSCGASMIVEPGNSLAQNRNADISYDKVDRTGRAYIQDHDDEVNRYDNFENNTESGMDSGYSLSRSEKADEYGGVDRTGKLYRPDTETNYDKLRIN